MTEQGLTPISQNAHDRLVQELADREGPIRTEIKNKIETAREEGDLKENGGYHAAREEQGKNEARVRQLKHLLENSPVAAPNPTPMKAEVLTIVTISIPAWEEEETFLLGSREETPPEGLEVYSPDSPLGGAVVGTGIGETCSYEVNGKRIELEILGVAPYSP